MASNDRNESILHELPPSASRHLTWSHSWTRPYESHISLVWRAIRINVLSPTLFKGFLIFEKERRTNTKPDAICEIATIKRALKIPGDIYQPESDQNFFKNARPLDLLSKTLRFCPECSREAYHSLLFQINDLAQCPLHRIWLLSRCPGCSEQFPHANLSLNTMAHPWGCARCHWPYLRTPEQSQAAWRDNSIDRIKSFAPVVAEIFRVISVADSEEWIKEIQYQGYCISRTCAFRLAAKWINASPQLESLLAPSSHQFARAVLPAQQGDCASTSGDTKPDLRAYLHIRRHAAREIRYRERYGILAGQTSWKWDPMTASRAPSCHDVSPRKLGFHLWRTAHELAYASLSFRGTECNLEGPVVLSPIHRRSHVHLQHSYALWAAYFHTSLMMFYELAKYWCHDVKKAMSDSSNAVDHQIETVKMIWAHHAPTLLINPTNANFPVKAVLVKNGSTSIFPPGTVLFFCVVPRKLA